MTVAWEMAPSGPAAVQAESLASLVPQIVTARLTLRAPVLADFDAYAAILGRDHAGHIGGPYTRDEAWADWCEAVAGWLLRGTGLWSVERRDTGRLAGFVTLHIEAGDPELELGYLFVPEAQGMGFATEAATAARDHAFSVLHRTTLVSYVAEGNAASVAVARRLGAVPDAGLVDGCLVFRHPHPEVRT